MSKQKTSLGRFLEFNIVKGPKVDWSDITEINGKQCVWGERLPETRDGKGHWFVLNLQFLKAHQAPANFKVFLRRLTRDGALKS